MMLPGSSSSSSFRRSSSRRSCSNRRRNIPMMMVRRASSTHVIMMQLVHLPIIITMMMMFLLLLSNCCSAFTTTTITTTKQQHQQQLSFHDDRSSCRNNNDNRFSRRRMQISLSSSLLSSDNKQLCDHHHHHHHPHHIRRKNLHLLFRRSNTKLYNVISKDDQDKTRFMYMNKEQDQLLVEKGNYEANCMKKPTPLQVNKVKVRVGLNKKSKSGGGFGGGGGGGGGGFGVGGSGGSKNKKKGGGANKKKNKQQVAAVNKSEQQPTEQQEKAEAIAVAETQQHVQTLLEDGLVRIDNVLDPQLCDSLRDYLIDLRSRATEDLESGKLHDSQERFADVLLNQNRCDLKIPLGPPEVLKTLHHLLSFKSKKGSIVRRVMESIYYKYGSDGSLATLYELNCFMSNSGARRQLVHADSVDLYPIDGLEDDEPIMLTCFIALQDTDETMGPTIWIPGTHNQESHHIFFETGERGSETIKTDDFSPKENLLKSSKSVIGTLPKGSCVIFDPRTLHCAGANTCDDPNKTRALFYMSYKNPKVDYPGSPSTSGYGIVNAELTIQNLANELEAELIRGEPAIRLKSVSCFP